MYTLNKDRHGPVQDFKCVVWTGPDVNKFNDGPVWSKICPTAVSQS